MSKMNLRKMTMAFAAPATQSAPDAVTEVKNIVTKRANKVAAAKTVKEPKAKVKVYAAKKLVKTATAPKTTKAFTITVTKAVATGAKITLKATNAGGTSPASKAIKAP